MDVLYFENKFEIQKISKALSSTTRYQILQLTKNGPKDISRIAIELGQTEANVSTQVKILEKAGLLFCHYRPGEHGVSKMCRPTCKKLMIQIIGDD